jgi:hypothetical protein
MAATLRARYEHRQTGWIMLGLACMPTLCLAFILALTPPGNRSLPAPLLTGLCVVTAIVLVGFSSLSIVVTADYVVARFGVGIVRKVVPLADIVDVQVDRVRWYEGWGIHWTRRGMLYNVAGFDAIRIGMRNGKAVRIGSDDAPRLRAVILRAIDERRTRAAPAV